jgi:hypothetical protein
MVATITPDVKRLLEDLRPETRELVLALREVVLAVIPQATESVDVKARVLGYGYGPGYRDTVATLILSKGGAKLGLPYSAVWPDPRGLLEGAGKVHRHVQFGKLSDVRRPGIKSLLRASLAAWRERVAGGA